MKNVYLLGATFETFNMGVSALTAGTIKCILHRWPRAKISLLDYGKTGCTYTPQFAGRQVSVRRVNMRFSKKVYLGNNVAFLIFLALILKLFRFQCLRNKIIGGNKCLKCLNEADLVVSMAGGDSFSDIYGMERLLYVSLPQILVVLLGKKLILLPQTLGPFKGTIARAIAKYILRHAELIYSRDYQGLRDAKGLTGSKPLSDKIRFCYDVGFVVEPTPPEDLGLVGLPAQRKEGSRLVGLNISGLLFMGGYNRKNMFGLKVAYDKFVYQLIDFLIQGKGADILLIPHVFGNDGESDTPVCEKTYEVLRPRYGNSIGLARGRYDLGQIKYIIGLCDFFIGARMHACIAAISQNIPTVPVAYSNKFVGVMQTVGLEQNVVDLRKMRKEDIFSVVDRVFEQRGLVRQQLERTMPQIKETVLNLFEGMEGIENGTSVPSTAGRVPVGV